MSAPSKAEAPPPIKVTAAELAFVLDLAAKAEAPVGLTYSKCDVLSRFVALANSKWLIGELVEPSPVPEVELLAP